MKIIIFYSLLLFAFIWEAYKWWKCSMIHVTFYRISHTILFLSPCYVKVQLSSYLHHDSATKIRALFSLRCNTRFSIPVVLRTNNIAERKIVVRHWENFRGFLMKVMRLKPVRIALSIHFPDSSISSFLSSRQCDVVLSLSRRLILLFFRLPSFFINYDSDLSEMPWRTNITSESKRLNAIRNFLFELIEKIALFFQIFYLTFYKIWIINLLYLLYCSIHVKNENVRGKIIINFSYKVIKLEFCVKAPIFLCLICIWRRCISNNLIPINRLEDAKWRFRRANKENEEKKRLTHISKVAGPRQRGLRVSALPWASIGFLMNLWDTSRRSETYEKYFSEKIETHHNHVLKSKLLLIFI